MSLDKAIRHGKEKRRPYIKAKAVDATCRNHGSCTWCERNRRYKMRDKHPEEIPLCPPCSKEDVDEALNELKQAMEEMARIRCGT